MSSSGVAKWAAVAALAVVVLAGAAWLYANRGAMFKGSDAPTAANSHLARFAQGSLARLQTPAETPPAPDYGFKDPAGRPTSLAAFRGKVVIVNLWAMWCAPCRTEMPTLAALATAYADNPDVVVLPINVDATAEGVAEAGRFIQAHHPLPLYSDMSFKLPFLFPGESGGMPRTVLVDRQGRIRAHFTGDADWSGPEARALIDALLAEPA